MQRIKLDKEKLEASRVKRQNRGFGDHMLASTDELIVEVINIRSVGYNKYKCLVLQKVYKDYKISIC